MKYQIISYIEELITQNNKLRVLLKDDNLEDIYNAYVDIILHKRGSVVSNKERNNLIKTCGYTNVDLIIEDLLTMYGDILKEDLPPNFSYGNKVVETVNKFLRIEVEEMPTREVLV
jgi:hypothetical protein